MSEPPRMVTTKAPAVQYMYLRTGLAGVAVHCYATTEREEMCFIQIASPYLWPRTPTGNYRTDPDTRWQSVSNLVQTVYEADQFLLECRTHLSPLIYQAAFSLALILSTFKRAVPTSSS
jgi:hypothetical protein